MLCFAAQMCLGRWMGKVCRATGGRLSRLWSDRPCSAAATQASFRTTSKFEGNLAQRKTVAVHRASSHARPMGGHAGHHLGYQKMPISCGKAFRMRWAFVGKTSRERSRLLNPSASWSALREGSALAARILYLRGDHATAAGRVKDTFIQPPKPILILTSNSENHGGVFGGPGFVQSLVLAQVPNIYTFSVSPVIDGI